MSLRLTSPSFDHNGQIPSPYTCQGQDTAPALSWTGVPASAKSLALVVDDPDAPDPKAPKMTWVHWVVFGLAPSTKGLPEGGKLPAGAQAGLNDWKRPGYGGPCPPIGRHRYFFKLYALDFEPKLERPTKAELEKAMEGHVLDKAELMGTYQKGDS
jgi:Raf kinase inhibitor-like YbhB/YbcL family protein